MLSGRHPLLGPNLSCLGCSVVLLPTLRHGVRFGGGARPRLGSFVKIITPAGRLRFFEIDDDGPLNKVRLSSRHRPSMAFHALPPLTFLDLPRQVRLSSRHRVLELLCELDESDLGHAAARAARLEKPTKLMLTTIEIAVTCRYRARHFKVTKPAYACPVLMNHDSLGLVARLVRLLEGDVAF